MITEGSIEIDRPIEEVFRLTNEDVPKWSNLVVEDKVIEETREKIGTTFRTVTADRGQRMEFRGVITAYDPPYASAIKLTGQFFDVEAAYAFEELGRRTKVTQFSKVTGKGFMKLLFLLLGPLMNKSSGDALAKELRSLKKYCEAQATS